MATDNYDYPPQEGQKKKSGMSGCLLGCLIAFVVVVVLGILIAVLIARNWRTMLAAGATQVVEQVMVASGMPEAERAEVMEQVQRVTEALQNNQISAEQFGRLMEQLAESPLIPAFLVDAVEAKYLDSSGLSDEEKVAARMTLNRFIQGMVQKSIPREDTDAVMAHVADRQPDGNWQLREQVTDEQLRAFFEAAKTKADEAGIAEEVPEIDPSEELRKTIDAAMSDEAGDAALVPGDVELEPAAPVELEEPAGEP